MSKAFLERNKGFLLGLVLLVAIIGPVAVWGGSKNVYVDKNNHGSEDGSKDHPYRTIKKALKKAHENSTVWVAKGTYKENITIPKHVDLKGLADRDKVIIEASSDSHATVSMKHDTTLSNVTVKGGKDGVSIERDAKAHLYNDLIKKSDRDGIHIAEGSRDTARRVLIDKVRITDSGKAGIFSEKRFVVLINSDITLNDGDGIDFTAGVKAWLQDNFVNDNHASGASFVLDGSSINSKNNAFRRNGREGVEVNAYGAPGSITLKKASIMANKYFGVTKIARTPAGVKTFGSLFIDASRIEGNAIGNISRIFLTR